MPSQIAPFPGTCCSVKPLLGLLPPSLALKSRPCYSAQRLRSVRLNSAFGSGQHDPAQRLVSTHSVQPSALTLARAIQLHFGFSQRLAPPCALSPNSLGRCNAARYRLRPLLLSKPLDSAGAPHTTAIGTQSAQYGAGSGIASARACFSFFSAGLILRSSC